MHSKAANEKIDNFISWPHSELFSANEQTTLNYSDTLWDGVILNFDHYHLTLTEFFNDQNIT